VSGTRRVVRAIARLNIGGPARHVTLLDNGLRGRGFDSLLVYGSCAAEEGSLEYLLSELHLRAVKIPGLGRDIRPGADLRAFLSLLRLVFVERPDIVHTHTAKAGTIGRLAALAYNLTRRRVRRCVVIHTFHGHVFDGYFGKVGSRLVIAAERALAIITDCLITISDRQREDIVMRYAIAPRKKTAVIPLGLQLDRFLTIGEPSADFKRDQQLPPDRVVFGFVGRFVPIKELQTLVRALRMAVDRNPLIHLVLYGDGPERPTVLALVRELELEAHVTFGGWRHDLPAVYAAMDVAVLASRNEGTPVAVIESMAAGRCVLVTDVGGVSDVVRDGETGVLVAPGDVPGFAQAMNRLAASQVLRLRLGQRAREAVSARFESSRLVEDIATLYERTLTEKRGTSASGVGNS